MVTTLTLNHADCDATDSKRVSCLMAAFKRGHVKICKFLVKHVRQFPSDQDCQRYVNSILSTLPPSTAAVAAAAATTASNQQQQQQSSEKDLVKRCQQCMEVIVQAKDKQAQEANRNASLLLKEIDAEKSREQSKKAAAQRKREKRKLKKMKQGNKGGPDSGELTNESAPSNSSAAAPSDGKTDQQQNESESEDEEDEGDRDDFAKTSLSSNTFEIILLEIIYFL